MRNAVYQTAFFLSYVVIMYKRTILCLYEKGPRKIGGLNMM